MLGSFQSTASLCYSLLPVLSEEGLWDLGAVTAVTPQSSPEHPFSQPEIEGKKSGKKSVSPDLGTLIGAAKP